MEPVTTRIEEDGKEQIEKYAEQNDLTESEVLRSLIHRALREQTTDQTQIDELQNRIDELEAALQDARNARNEAVQERKEIEERHNFQIATGMGFVGGLVLLAGEINVSGDLFGVELTLIGGIIALLSLILTFAGHRRVTSAYRRISTK